MPSRPDVNETRTGHRGRPSALNDSQFAKLVAMWFADGATRRQMAEEFNVNEWTITQWRKDPRVKVHTDKVVEDRILAITRKTDTEIQRRLEHAKDLSVKEILEIRKEFLGGVLRQKTEKIDEETVQQGMAALEEDPALMEAFSRLLDEQPQKPQGGLISEPQDGISEDLLGDDEA